MGGGLSAEKLDGQVDAWLQEAANDTLRDPTRVAALRHVQRAATLPEHCRQVQTRLTLPANLDCLLALIRTDRPWVVSSALQILATISNTRDIDVKTLLGQRILGQLADLLQVDDVRVRAIVVEVAANLLTEPNNRDAFVAANALPRLTESLGSTYDDLLVHSARAVAELAQTKALRYKISEEEGLLPMVALCFVGNMYGLVRYHALRGVANLAKEEPLRREIISIGIPSRLSRLVLGEDDMVDPIVQALVASIFCNLSLAEDTTSIEAHEAIPVVYTLVFSEEVDAIVEGLWAVANYCKDHDKRRELIETNGVRLCLNLLKIKEVQVWYEVSRILRNVSAGTSAQRRFLLAEGALEALYAIYGYCAEPVPADKPRSTFRRRLIHDEDDDVDLVATERAARDAAQDVEQSARFMTMTVATHAVKNLTVFPEACTMFMEMGGDKPLMSLLRMEFNSEGQQYAAAALGNIAQNADYCQKLVYDGIIETLVELLKLSGSYAVHREVAYALSVICSHNRDNERVVIDGAAVAALVAMLNRGVPRDVAQSIFRFFWMVTIPEAKYEMLRGGVVGHIFKYAADPTFMEDREFRKICVGLLKSLAELNDDSQQMSMVDDGIFGPLVKILSENREDTEMCALAAELVGSLTIRSDFCKQRLLQEPAIIPALVELLRTEDPTLLFHTLTIVGNLSSMEAVRDELATYPTVLPAVCQALLTNQFALMLQGIRALVYLTMHAQNARDLPQIVGVELLMELCHDNNPTVQRHTATVIANLAQHEVHWDLLLQNHVLPELQDLLKSTNFEVAREAVRGIANMSQSNRAIVKIDELNLLDTLAEMLKHTVADRGQDQAQVASFVGARTQKMQVQLLYAMRLLCRTEHMLLRVVKEFDCLPIFIHLLESSGVDVRREAAGCLAVVLKKVDQRMAFHTLNGLQATMKALKASLAIGSELRKELRVLEGKLASPAPAAAVAVAPPLPPKAAPRLLELPAPSLAGTLSSAPTPATGPAPTPAPAPAPEPETPEQLMASLAQKREVQLHNHGLQTELMKVVYLLAEEGGILDALISGYDWPVFMAPLGLPELEGQEWASRANFRLVKAGKKLEMFVRDDGVRYVCRAFRFESVELRRLAVETMALLSGVDGFLQALLEEGGPGTLIALLQCEDPLVLGSAFQTVGTLAANAALADMFLEQGILPRLLEVGRLYGEVDDGLVMALVTTSANLASHDHVRRRWLEANGLKAVIMPLSNENVEVQRHALGALVTLSAKDDVRDQMMDGNNFDRYRALLGSHYPDIVRDALQVLLNIAGREVFREMMFSDAFTADCIAFLDEVALPTLFQRRQLEAHARNPALRMEDDAVYLAEQPRGSLGEVTLQKLVTEVSDKKKKNIHQVCAAIALLAVKLLGCLVSLDPVKKRIVDSNALQLLLELFKSEQLEPKWQSVRILAQCCTLEELCGKLAAAQLVHHTMIVSDFDNAEVKRQAAKIFASLATHRGLHAHFVPHQVIVRIKALASSKVREIQVNSCAALSALTVTPPIRDVCIGLRIPAAIAPFLDVEHAVLRTHCLRTLRNLVTAMFLTAAPEDEAWELVKGAMAKALAIYRDEGRDLGLTAAAFEFLAEAVLADPVVFGVVFTDAGGMRDMKAAFTQFSHVLDSGTDKARARKAAARVLFAITLAPDHRAVAIRTLSVDELLDLLRIDSIDAEVLNRHLGFACDMIKSIGNYSMVPAQREKLLKAGGMSLLLEMFHHQELEVRHAATYTLACVAEGYRAIPKVLATVSIEYLVHKLAEETAHVAALRPKMELDDVLGTTRSVAEPARDALLPYRYLYELARLLANVTDGAEDADQGIIGPLVDELRKDVLEPVQDFEEHFEIRWQLQAALARTASRVPPPVAQAGQLLPMTQLDQIATLLQERRDGGKLEGNLKTLALLAQRLRPRDGAVSEGVRKVLDRGVVPSLVPLLKSGDAKVHTYAAWALVDLAAEHSDVRQQLMQQGLADIVKIATNATDPKRFVAGKVLAVCLRERGITAALAKSGMEVRLPIV